MEWFSDSKCICLYLNTVIVISVKVVKYEHFFGVVKKLLLNYEWTWGLIWTFGHWKIHTCFIYSQKKKSVLKSAHTLAGLQSTLPPGRVKSANGWCFPCFTPQNSPTFQWRAMVQIAFSPSISQSLSKKLMTFKPTISKSELYNWNQ